MKIAFDLDGTLYDSFSQSYDTFQALRKDLEYVPDISKEDYKSIFQSRDWKKLYLDLGIKEEDLSIAISNFSSRYKQLPPPGLVPGTREVLDNIESKLGSENIFIITNLNSDGIKRRFERDGLVHYISRVQNPFQGKSEELYNLAIKNKDFPFLYVGDLVSDGLDCKDAISRGATNIKFGGIIHSYSMNSEDIMRNFIQSNSDFAQILNNLSDIENLLL